MHILNDAKYQKIYLFKRATLKIGLYNNLENIIFFPFSSTFRMQIFFILDRLRCFYIRTDLNFGDLTHILDRKIQANKIWYTYMICKFGVHTEDNRGHYLGWVMTAGEESPPTETSSCHQLRLLTADWAWLRLLNDDRGHLRRSKADRVPFLFFLCHIENYPIFTTFLIMF